MPFSEYCENFAVIDPFNDRATNRFVSRLAPGPAWVGGRQNTGRGWQWTDGSRWGFESWARGQPDNGGVWGGEDFLGINFRRKGRWNDWPLNGHEAWINPVKGFVCQHKIKGLIFQEVNSQNGMPNDLLLEPPTATVLNVLSKHIRFQHIYFGHFYNCRKICVKFYQMCSVFHV